MKILIATGIYPPDIGGPATWSSYFAEEFTRRGNEVTVLTYSDALPAGKDAWKVHRVLRSSGSGIRHLRYFMKVLSLMRRADITILGDTISAGVPVWTASFIARRPYVLKIGGDWVWEQSFQRWSVKEFLDDFLAKRYPAKIEFFRWLQLQVARRARAVLVPSHYLKSVATRWGVPPENIFVIYNNINMPHVLLSKEEAKDKLNVPKDALLLLALGRSVGWKGFQMLRDLAPEFPQAVFKIGEIPRGERDMWFAAADIFLLNTAYEGFSHQLLEAMALGLPIIATNAGGNGEILEDGKNGLVAAYNDKNAWQSAITRLLGNPEFRALLSEHAGKTASRFLNMDTIGETSKVLEEII